MTDLLPCPFCGGKAELKPPPYDVIDGKGWYIGCIDRTGKAHDGGQISASVWGASREEAIRAWNTRAPSSAQGATTVGEAEIQALVREWNEVRVKYGAQYPEQTFLGDRMASALTRLQSAKC